MESSNFKESNVVVTGGSGFIGVNHIQRLVNEGAIVTSIDIKEPPLNAKSGSVNFIKADINNSEDYQEAVSKCDYCFHLAARTDLSGMNISDYATNFEGTKRVIEAIKVNRRLKRFFFFSTQLVVGNFNESRFIDESEPYKTKTLYGQSKILGEQIVIKHCKEYDLPFTIIRPTSVYGPYGNEPYRDFFLTIKQGKYFHIGKANNLISMVFVKNLINQTLFLALHPKAEGEIFFGNDLYPYTMRQFSTAAASYWNRKLFSIPDFIIYPITHALGLLKLFGIPVPIYPFRLKNIKSTYCYSIQKSLDLGYLPKYSYKEGISETLKWYEENDAVFRSEYAHK